MVNITNSTNQPVDLLSHPAVLAWQRVDGPKFVPERVDVVKLKKKSAVYRLTADNSTRKAVIAKRCPAATGFVERLVYQEILTHISAPALRCLGFVAEPETEYCWLFLDDAGPGEYSPTCAEHRKLAGQCLALVQRAARHAAAQAWLPERGPRYYLELLHSARSSLLRHLHNPDLSDDEAVLLYALAIQLDLIEEHWGELEQFCARQPHTVVHGDFVTKNLRIWKGANAPVLVAFDWEMAGWGVPATDLAQFLGSCASPDLATYLALLREEFPQMKQADVVRVADYGKLLRLVDKIFWMTTLMVKESRQFLLKPLSSFEIYREELSAALRAVAWSSL